MYVKKLRKVKIVKKQRKIHRSKNKKFKNLLRRAVQHTEVHLPEGVARGSNVPCRSPKQIGLAYKATVERGCTGQSC
jgi:hypothetical protein